MTVLLKIAVPCPLRQIFDYLGEDAAELWQPGIRVKVPFGNRELIGLCTEVIPIQNTPDKLKFVIERLDDEPVIDASLNKLIMWVSHYYHHPLGECYQAALPKKLRNGEQAVVETEKFWQLTSLDLSTLRLGVKQQQLIDLLTHAETGLSQTQINKKLPGCSQALRSLEQKDVICASDIAKQPASENVTLPADSIELNEQQLNAVETVWDKADNFNPFLLHGITGSGKTEVYIELTKRMLAQDRQVLILIPEIGLTGQFVSRFRQQIAQCMVVLHSSVSAGERKQGWLLAKAGIAKVIIGTRSAVFTPLQQPGIIILDEEHDASYKQQDGLRYHARNVALIRAQQLNIPIVLGSATPSLESLYQVEQQRYELLTLSQRAGNANLPKVKLADSSALAASDTITPQLRQAITGHLASGNQVLLFINRRGYAPVLMCHDCGWQARCDSCDARMVMHQQKNILFCHHCGLIKRLPPKCPSCQSEDLNSYGAGTEKIELTLQRYFPDFPVLRIDRDTTQRVNAFAEMVAQIKQGQAQILVGTQMLAKGHDFHDVTLVGVLDADQGLYSADFRATENLAQLITQVTGRAGRGDKQGEVIIQTSQPQHPFWQQLITQGYETAAKDLLQQRIDMQMPPASFWGIIRAESKEAETAMQYLAEVADIFNQQPVAEFNVFGPVPAIMEKRAGRFRAQLLLISSRRRLLHQQLDRYLEQISQLKLARKVRWSIDIDPIDLL